MAGGSSQRDVDFQTAYGYDCDMPVTVESMAKEALELPVSGRAFLVEQLLDSLSGEVNSEAEQAHLVEIELRRSAVAKGDAKLIEGGDAMRQARNAMRK